MFNPTFLRFPNSRQEALLALLSLIGLALSNPAEGAEMRLDGKATVMAWTSDSALVGIAMDDFGTGHSSLSGLHRFPIDVLKIDQSFVKSMEQSRALAAVINAIVTLAQHLGMAVVAEGVETTDQLAALQAHGCDFAQGYLFSKPLRAEDAERYLAGGSDAAAA